MTSASVISYCHQTEQAFSQQCNKVGSFLDKNPTCYKVVLAVSHLFRASSMFGIMSTLPMSPPLAFATMLAPSLLYRSSIERFCIFRFTLPSLAGGTCMWAARAGIASFLAKTALASMSSFALASVGILSFAAYLGYICAVSHSDVERYMQTLPKGKGACCR